MKVVFEKDLIPGKVYRLITKFRFIGFGNENGKQTIKTLSLYDNSSRLIEETEYRPYDKWIYNKDDNFRFGRRIISSLEKE